MNNDEKYMRLALEQAHLAYKIGEVPVGAVVVRNGEVVGTGYNRRETDKNAVAHAELIAIDNACKRLGGWRLWECELYVTLEPCPMCAGAIINSRIRRLVYGASDKKAGSIESVVKMLELPYNHRPPYLGGVLQEECAEILKSFFREMRSKK
ncbi:MULTISPECIES: tRNA adenosine(34) deaminase TadA [unclassified Ruminococcus]|uniref:tRNA adenosine(34) deaminase TadA n=1 Tax=unclassified Ruminococcus TaxID=2608920 RepID=UPI002109DDD2|nr:MULTISPECIES: tRNA adenosine(34) deaminase TadA [unclassified Ruminococcus]MCQ4022251.1 tRNA-specific adenosine deaminase [Ruminococcus sp. zg-924]MCQ4114579.1 tRNA-specific adenosine deaminase [Ruminococcus sp. zg-921]